MTLHERVLFAPEIFAPTEPEPPDTFAALVRAVADLADRPLLLRPILRHLPWETQIKLVIVMYAGRGEADFAPASWRYFAGLFPRDTPPLRDAVEKLLSKKRIAEHLREGLRRAEREGFDVERATWARRDRA